MENVKHIQYKKIKTSGSHNLQAIANEQLKKLGYFVKQIPASKRLLNAKDFGVAQNGERVLDDVEILAQNINSPLVLHRKNF